MKTLIIVAHPNIDQSVFNRGWLEELKKSPDKYTVHELYKVYPDGNIDVAQEQQLIEAHDQLILQFPFYWFNCPPILKKWLDDVFTYGWAYGSDGDKLKNRKVGLALSVGIEEQDYSEEGRYHYTLEQLLAPFETTFRYCGADYRSFFALYGTEKESAANELEASTQRYLQFIDHL